ncbi:CDP-diacylglycerol--serine O-phosphatidyltransferase [Bartonella sp. HY038]|uniref:CDP-diacylglycerol--serine O-phosphatidyltransferase n=1 Tax=Bartonella sp. HY038 TaxID=2759660 RepID=UPI0015FE7AB2|nr:CDP-diacylglycerol--serine O-phosphatidyltransferase [Bartonella sp. HY038]
MKSASPFPPFEPDNNSESEHHKRRAPIAMRYLVPNVITVLAIVAGLSSIRMAIEHRFESAIFMMLIAAVLDGIDGRIARLMNGSSPFGEQMDSLADAINFGVAPAIICYIYILDQARNFGWMAAVVYCVACCLRLARFNVALERHDTPDWQKHYFVGIPAPAGGCLLVLPIYLGAFDLPVNHVTGVIFSIYTLAIAFLMVSKLPVYNGKSIGKGVRRDIVVPLMLVIVAYVVLLVSYTWLTLTISAFLYLIFLPISVFTYHRQEQKEKLRNFDKDIAPS